MDVSDSSPLLPEFTDHKDGFPPIHFQTRYRGIMLMYAASSVVTDYLNRHEGWFCRCAQPMKVEPFTEKGYILTVGNFSSFGYEVEPKIAVLLDPPEAANYKMYNVPLPDEPYLGYGIDYKADMQLSDTTWQDAIHDVKKATKLLGDRPIPENITQVTWQLHLQVMVQFPKFIYKLPRKVIKSTGDRLLSSIVSQVSPRLTTKVQQDFHHSFNLPTPPKSARSCTFVSTAENSEEPTAKKEDIANHNAPAKSIIL